MNSLNEFKTRLDDAVAAGHKKLGDMFWWSTEGVNVTQAEVETAVSGAARAHGFLDSEGEFLTGDKVCPQLQPRGAVRKALADIGITSSSKRNKNGAPGDRVLFTRRLDAHDDESLTQGDFSVVILEETYQKRYGRTDVTPVHREVQRVRYDSKAKDIGLETDLLEAEIRAGFRK